jgi:hypothetical protein
MENPMKTPKQIIIALEMNPRYIENLAKIQKRIEDIIHGTKCKSKLVVFIDPEGEIKGYIERVESIIVDKF